MCGIVGYVGIRSNPVEVVIEGLKQLEYRGMILLELHS